MMPAKRKSAEIQKRLALQEAAVTWAMEGLNTAEAKAMRVLMKGSSVTYAAMVAGVARSTLYDWLEPGRPLAAALDKWKRDLANTARTRLLTFCDLATHNVRDALRNGDTRTALRVLEKLGILDTPPVGPSDSDMRAEEEFHETEQTQRDARYTQLMEKIISLPSPAAEPVRKELTSEKNSA
jgi:hypothetical protein